MRTQRCWLACALTEGGCPTWVASLRRPMPMLCGSKSRIDEIDAEHARLAERQRTLNQRLVPHRTVARQRRALEARASHCRAVAENGKPSDSQVSQ